MHATFTAPNVLEHTRVNTDSKLLRAPSDITKTNEMKVTVQPKNVTPKVSASCRAPSEPKMWVS